MADVSVLARAVQRNTPGQMKIEDQTILLYGREKIGKSTAASMIGKPVFLDLEGGLRNIECDRIPIKDWSVFKKAINVLEQDIGDFTTTVVDTGSKMWEFCRRDVLAANNWGHEQDAKFGRAYDAIKDEFAATFERLMNLPTGLIVIAHDQTEEISKPTKIVSYTSARLDKRCRAVIEPAVEMILFADTETTSEGTKRVLRTKRTEFHEAGDRSGRLPETLELDARKLIEAYGG